MARAPWGTPGASGRVSLTRNFSGFEVVGHTCVLRKTACHALQDTACLDLDWSTEPSPVSAARVAPEKGLNASEDLP